MKQLVSVDASILSIPHLCQQQNCIHQERCPFGSFSPTQREWEPSYRLVAETVGPETSLVVKCRTCQAVSNLQEYREHWNTVRAWAHDALKILQVFQIDDPVLTIKALQEHPNILSAQRAADLLTIVDNEGHMYSMSIFEIMSEEHVNRSWRDHG